MMVTVIHAFNENPGEGQDKHLEYWYGSVRLEHDDLDDGAPVVCWCGGRCHKLSADVAVVWHLDFWPTMHKARDIPND
jgi:hypothetical protein